MTDKQLERMAYRLPVYFDWVEYKGERCVAQFNWERSKIAKKPMMDISICMTRALNQNIIKTVQYDKSKFKIL